MQLISIEVSDEDTIRTLAAFGGTVDQLKAELRAWIGDKVATHELAVVAERHNRERRAVVEKVKVDVVVAIGNPDPLATLDETTGLSL